MMKKALILLIFVAAFNFSSNAQVKLNDFGRVVLNTYLPANMGIPAEAKKLLETKLNQITSNNGMGGSQVNPRFIITAAVNVGTKNIIAGPPQMVSQNVELTLFVGDALTNTIFASTTLNLMGVEGNENKAFIEAFNLINPKSKEISEFLLEGKNKIISYYVTQCDFIIKETNTLVKLGKYDQAIYQLSIVPDVCQECYYKCLDTLANIYQQKIDRDCEFKLNKSRTIWAAQQNSEVAEAVGNILSTINPTASCQDEVKSFINVIDAKLKADEKARWEFKMKQYADQIAMQKEQIRIAESKSIRDDQYRDNQAKVDAVRQQEQATRNYELDKIRLNAYREVAVEYAKNQPKTINYNSIYWR